MTSPDPTPEPQMVETHTAHLILLGDHAYKLKKAIDLGFVDQRDREQRLAICRREVELNRRIAPDVYEGVIDIIDENGELADHMVKMRRMPDERRLSKVIGRGEDVGSALGEIAQLVSELHAASEPDPEHDRLGHRDSVRQRWSEGFVQLRDLVSEPVASQMREMERLADRYLAGRAPLFDRRVAEGRIRDGHGDLQADDIFLLEDGPRILDCLEFGDEYRWGDVLSDVAFLAMDLERLGRPDLAARFLELHGDIGDDR